LNRSIAVLLLLALTIAIYWKVAFGGYTWLENPDPALQVRPWLDYEAREIHAGRLPFWDPYHYGGQSLIGQVQPGIANPLNWILFAIPLRDGHIRLGVLHWYWILIHWLAAVFAFWLCRDLGANCAASLAGASIFAFAGFMGKSLTPQFLMSALFCPLVFLFLARVFRGERPLANAALAGASLGAAFLSGHHNVPIYCGVVAGAVFLARWRWLPVFGLAAVLVAGLQIAPAVEYGRQSVRWSGAPEPQRWHDKLPYSVHDEYSLRASSLAGVVLPNRPAHASPYVGFTALGLALVAIVTGWRSLHVRLMLAVAMGGLVLALGSGTPVHYLVYRFVPMVDKARYPAMSIVIFEIGIAALAALALQRFPRAAWLALPLVLLEASLNPPPLELPGRFANLIASQSDLASFLKAQPGWFRMEADEDAVPYNFGDLYGIEEFSGYVASMPERIFLILGHEPTPRLFGIEYWVARKPRRGYDDEVFTSQSGVKVWRNPRISEPLWTEPAGGEVRVVRRLPNEMVVEADLPAAGVLVAGDPYYSGWRAYVDGQRVRIRAYDGVTRAVPVAAGHHRVEFRFRPVSVYLGAAMSALGLLLVVVVVKASRMRGLSPAQAEARPTE